MAFDPTARSLYTGVADERIIFWNGQKWIDFAYTSANRHSGLVEEGQKLFISMYKDYGVKAGIEHYGCMVDLLGRADKMEEAGDLIMKSDFGSNPSLWSALLCACATTINPDVAERVARKMIELKPDYHLSYVHLANVCGTVGRWKDSHEFWNQMENRGVKSFLERAGLIAAALQQRCMNGERADCQIFSSSLFHGLHSFYQCLNHFFFFTFYPHNIIHVQSRKIIIGKVQIAMP